MKSVLSLTPNAFQKIQKLFIDKEYRGVRISLKSKGCAALAYEMTFVQEKNLSDEEVVLDEHISLFIQSQAVMFLIGSEMDYQETALKSGFIFNNPNEKGRCGCGVSFYV